MSVMPVNSTITAMARQTLKGRWWKNAGLLFVLLIFKLIAEGMLGMIFTGKLLPLKFGMSAVLQNLISAFLLVCWFEMVKCDDCNFDKFQEALKKFGSFTGAGILYGIILFFGFLFFIIPGIIMQFSYAMVFFILADDPAMPVIAALKLSRKMMKGYKWKLFCLNFRFLGWGILSVFTLGIGFLFLIPYQAASNIHFYRNLKAVYEAQNGEIACTEYKGMSVVNTILIALLVLVWNAGIVGLFVLSAEMLK